MFSRANGGPNNGNSRISHFGRSFDQNLSSPARGQVSGDSLIRNIPSPENALGSFQSVPSNSPPQRDIPSILIAHLGRPITSDPEPKWTELLNYFSTDRALQGMANLQDLYVFITRIAIPNTIITNRRLVLAFFTSNENQDAPQNIRLRYDSWGGKDYLPLEREQPLPASFPLISPRPILRSGMTPNGNDFLRWLHLPPDALPQVRVPQQMIHRRTQLDLWLDENEAAVRRTHPRALLARTAKVLSMFWWLSGCNEALMGYERAAWVGMQREVA